MCLVIRYEWIEYPFEEGPENSLRVFARNTMSAFEHVEIDGNSSVGQGFGEYLGLGNWSTVVVPSMQK